MSDQRKKYSRYKKRFGPPDRGPSFVLGLVTVYTYTYTYISLRLEFGGRYDVQPYLKNELFLHIFAFPRNDRETTTIFEKKWVTLFKTKIAFVDVFILNFLFTPGKRSATLNFCLFCGIRPETLKIALVSP